MKRALTEEESEKIEQAIFDAGRIEAVNIYISSTECGLTEAQDYIRALTEQLKATSPEKFVRKSRKRHLLG